MELYPAIDLRNTQVVRLYQGDFQQQTNYAFEPMALAQRYQEQGAKWLHVVDLDAAKNPARESVNLPVIAEIASQCKLMVQSGGGVRQMDDVRAKILSGISRVVIGSSAVQDPSAMAEWLAEFGADALCLALDCKADAAGVYKVHVSGWQQASSLELFELLDRFSRMGFEHVLVTDISQDGTLAGPNLKLYADLQERYPEMEIQASGGVSSLLDLQALAGIACGGAIVGKALLEQRFQLHEAYQALKAVA